MAHHSRLPRRPAKGERGGRLPSRPLGKGRAPPAEMPRAKPPPAAAEAEEQRRRRAGWEWWSGRRRDTPGRRSEENAEAAAAEDEEVEADDWRGWLSIGSLRVGVSWIGGLFTEVPLTQTKGSNDSWGG